MNSPITNSPILSICIPTYNRSFYLKDCLRDLTEQLVADGDLINNVEILISDNCSIDDTQSLVAEYQKRYANIKYFKNEKNVGFDLNVVNSIEKATGKYCMYLGDDDAIAIGGIRYLVDFLRKNELSVLTYELVDYSNLNKSKITNGTIKDELIHVTNSHNDFLNDSYSHGVFNNFTFDRKLWLENVDKNNHIKDWLYYDVILKMSAVAKYPLVHFSYPIALAKQGCLWNKNGGEIFVYLTYKVMLEKCVSYGYNYLVINKLLSKLPRRLIITTLRAKGNDLKISWKNYKMIHDGFHKNYLYFFIVTLIFFIPNWIIKLIRDFNKKITKIKT